MTTRHLKMLTAETQHAQTVCQLLIAATDRQIARLVYDLYGLTDEEVRIVQEETAT